MEEVKPKTRGYNEPSEELEQGKEDCYWCGRVFDKSTMRLDRSRGIKVYICKDC